MKGSSRSGKKIEDEGIGSLAGNDVECVSNSVQRLGKANVPLSLRTILSIVEP